MEKAIESCLEQSYTDCELVLLDDGSADNSGAVAERYLSQRNSIRLIRLNHVGIAQAFNEGMQAASGKFIARMDADDVMHPDRIRKQVEFLEANPDVGLVSCLVNYGGDRRKQEGYARHVDWINSLVTPDEIALNRFVDSPVCNPSVMFRKELVEQYGGAVNGNFPEDYEMWLRWMDAGVQFAKIPETLFTWNDLPTRLTRTDARYSSDAFERAKTRYLSRFIRKNNFSNRPVYLCGTGRITRRKSDHLVEDGLTISGYIDIDPAKIGTTYNELPVIGLSDLPAAAYIVNYVSVRGAREGLRELFTKQGLNEGLDFISAG